MAKMTMYPLGNADCCRIDLNNTQKILFDYADCRCADDPNDCRIDLAAELKKDLKAASRDYYDVVAFTHLDTDHICKSTEFFWLQHAQKYQSSDRIKINELWVPAAVITEDKCEDEARILQAEARYRLRQKFGIRVSSRPGRLKEWLEKNGMTLEEVAHLITDAGQTIPGFTKEAQGVEFFVHSPFAKRLNECDVEDRNQDSLVVQATFLTGWREVKAILGADTTYEMWQDIVDITKFHGREERLEWDIFKLPHHCSYLSLGPEKGEDKTEPVEQVKWIFEQQSRKGAVIVSTSKPIPEKGTAEDEDPQPPHRQAANYYRERLSQANLDGEFKVTMEHPKRSKPEPLVIIIDGTGARVEKTSLVGAIGIVSRPAPRAG